MGRFPYKACWGSQTPRFSLPLTLGPEAAMMLDWKLLGILLLCLCSGGVLGIETGTFGVRGWSRWKKVAHKKER